jgi:TonB family protein
VHTVTLLKLPPPPPIKEKPPEPKVEEKKEVIKTEPDQQPQSEERQSETPAGEQLGVDAEGSAGSDGFGLVAKKGGRPLIGGSSGDQSLLRKYAWYTQFLEEEIRKKVREHLDRHGGIPEGNLKIMVRVTLNERGAVTDHAILASSGSHKMDTAVAESLKSLRLREPPPEGMPSTLRLRITSQG